MKTLDILIFHIKLVVITAIIVISFLSSNEIYCKYLKVHNFVLYKKYIRLLKSARNMFSSCLLSLRFTNCLFIYIC